jgi:hypothetical protein
LLGHGIGQRLIFQVFIPLHPLLKLDNFQRIRRSSERRGEQRVRKEGNRCNQ